MKFDNYQKQLSCQARFKMTAFIVKNVKHTYHINCGFLREFWALRKAVTTHVKKIAVSFLDVYEIVNLIFFLGQLFVLQKCDGHSTMNSRVVPTFILLTVSNVVGPPSPLRSHKYHLHCFSQSILLLHLQDTFFPPHHLLQTHEF